MALLAFNKTASPLALAAGGVTLSPIVSGARGRGNNVTSELKNLSGGDYAALQAQVDAGDVEFQWTSLPEYPTPGLTVGSAQGDVTEDTVVLFADPAGDDTNSGFDETTPKASFAGMWAALPVAYRKGCHLYFDKDYDPASSAVNLTIKTYEIPASMTDLLFPRADGPEGESFYAFGGFTNEIGDQTAAAAGNTVMLLTDVGAPGWGVNAWAGYMVQIVVAGVVTETRVIRSNTADSIVPEEEFSAAHDNATYRIVQDSVRFKTMGELHMVPPEQNAIFDGISIYPSGANANRDLVIGQAIGGASGGAIVLTRCEVDGRFDKSGNKRQRIRTRGRGGLNLDGNPGMWIGPNNKLTGTSAGCYIHDLSNFSVNIGGYVLGGAGRYAGFNIAGRSTGVFYVVGGTLDGVKADMQGASQFDFSSSDFSSVGRGRWINCAGGDGCLKLGTLARAVGTGNAGALWNIDFANNLCPRVELQDGQISIGANADIGGNVGADVVVSKGGELYLDPAAFTGSAAGVTVDGTPLTSAQAQGSPFGGAIKSRVHQGTSTIADPGDAGVITVPPLVDGSCALTSAGAETRTLAAPTSLHQRATLAFNVRVGGDIVVTSAVALNAAGNNTATFTAAGQSLDLVAVTQGGALRWAVAGNDGPVTLTTV